MVASVIGGEHLHRFRPLIDLYREAGVEAGSRSQRSLQVGIHSIGFLGDTSQGAADDFFPGYASCVHGDRKGTRPGRFHHPRPVRPRPAAPAGALLIGDAEEVAEKRVLSVNEVLGGISRLNFQMTVAAISHSKMMRAIEILGTRVAPIVRKELSAAPVGA